MSCHSLFSSVRRRTRSGASWKQVNATWHMKHSTTGLIQCLERTVGTLVAIYFIFAGESLGWDWLLCICPKSTEQMVFHWTLSRSNYSAFLQSLDTFSMWPVFFIILVWRVFSASEAVQTWPLRQVASTSRLTDPNNTKWPQLTSQQKAVEAFHSRYKEVEATLLQVTNQSIPSSSSTHITPSINQSKHNLSADTDSDTDNNKLVKDDSGDEQPKHRKSLVFTSQMAIWNCFTAKKRCIATSNAKASKGKSIATIMTDDEANGSNETDGPKGM